MEPNTVFPLPPAVNLGVDFGLCSMLNRDHAGARLWFDIAARSWEETYGLDTPVPDEVWAWVADKVREDYPTLPRLYPLVRKWLAVGGDPACVVGHTDVP